MEEEALHRPFLLAVFPGMVEEVEMSPSASKFV
jgi:hypothetical protein